jgi:hypothetical protein
MLRAEVRATFTVVYRGYDIEVSRGPTGWRAGVYPRSADLPILNEVQTSDQDEAVIEAMDRIDGVLRHGVVKGIISKEDVAQRLVLVRAKHTATRPGMKVFVLS